MLILPMRTLWEALPPRCGNLIESGLTLSMFVETI